VSPVPSTTSSLSLIPLLRLATSARTVVINSELKLTSRYTSQFFESDWTTGKPQLSAQGQAAVEAEIKRVEGR
jgi:hypothetical protein